MKDFKFASSTEEQEIEKIIKSRKQKIAKQQLIFFIIFLLVAAGLFFYLTRKVVYSDFDGYFNTPYHQYRALSDMYMQEIYVEAGDVVKPGDTLFSFVYASQILNNENVFNAPNTVTEANNKIYEYRMALQELEVLKVSKKEIERLIQVAKHNVEFGVSTNSYLMNLEKELAENQASIAYTQNKCDVLKNIVEEESVLLKYTNSGDGALTLHDIANKELMSSIGMIRYGISPSNSIITKVWVPNNTGVLKGEPIIYSQDFDLLKNNLGITCLVPVNKIDKISNHAQVTVIVNDNLSFSAHVKMIGTRTEVIPEHLRNRLTKDFYAIAAEIAIDHGQHIPLWAIVKDAPVTIRVSNFRDPRRRIEHSSHRYFNTTTGELTDSLETIHY